MLRRTNWIFRVCGCVAIAGLIGLESAYADPPGSCVITPEEAQMNGINGWAELPVFTIGESIDGYTPPGIPDGMGAMKWRRNTVRVLVNHELTAPVGYPYSLASGATLTGARVSYFDIDRDSFGVCGSGLAYDTIYNRAGDVVTSPADLDFGGLNRLCSSVLFTKGEFGLRDDCYFTGEETGGGSEFILDIKRGELWAAPALGRAAWENVTLLDTGDRNTVAVLVGDDRGGAPLILYVGNKSTKKRRSNFLERNGLADGKLYIWVADNGDLSPEDWNGTGTSRTGQFVEIDYYRPDLAGNGDYDELGYATQSHQDALAAAAGAFQFSRPEDVATAPFDGKLAVMASTGRSSLFPSDSWGTTYLIDVDFSDLSATLSIVYDGDEADKQDFGIRSPDNLDWADDGYLYINEDRSVGGFGQTSGIEASIWKLDPLFPVTGDVERIAIMNRDAVLPGGQTDGDPDDIGDWESSGVLDVSDLFDIDDATLLIANVQAHSVRDGSIGGDANLVQGGQLFFLINADDEDDDDENEEDDD